MTSKEEWFTILDQEKGQNLAASITEEIVTKSQNVLFQRKIECNLIPYTINFIKNTLKGAISLRYMKPDKFTLDSSTWEPDLEPEPVIADSLARGILSVKKDNTDGRLVKKGSSSASSFGAIQSSRDQSSMDIRGHPLEKEKKPFAARRFSSGKKGVLIGVPQTESDDAKVLLLEKEVVVEVKKNVIIDMSIKSENQKMMARIRNLEKDGEKADFTYDQEGRIILVNKTRIPKLSNQSIRANLAPEEAPKKPKLTSYRPYSKKNASKPIDNTIYIKSEVLETADTDDIPTDGFIPDSSSDMPNLIDLIKVTPGVIFKEGDAVRKGGPLIVSQKPFQPHPPTTAPNVVTDPLLSKILEKARPIIKTKE